MMVSHPEPGTFLFIFLGVCMSVTTQSEPPDSLHPSSDIYFCSSSLDNAPSI